MGRIRNFFSKINIIIFPRSIFDKYFLPLIYASFAGKTLTYFLNIYYLYTNSSRTSKFILPSFFDIENLFHFISIGFISYILLILYNILKDNENIFKENKTLLNKINAIDIDKHFEQIKNTTNTNYSSMKDEFLNIWGEIFKNNNEQWESFKKSRDIVINVKVTEIFDHKHVVFLQDKLERAFPNIKEYIKNRYIVEVPDAHIYALDASNPKTWLTENMLCYLAIQAEWKSWDFRPKHERLISRIFVMHPSNLNSIIGKRIIIFHRLLGFDTYVVAMDEFKKKFHEIKNLPDFCDNKLFDENEFVVWDGFKSTVDVGNLGYRSFWRVSTDFDKRNSEINCNRVCADDEVVKIKFDSFETKEQADCYTNFFKLLINDPLICENYDKYQNEANKWDNKFFILKIDTFNTDIISELLDGYSKYCLRKH